MNSSDVTPGTDATSTQYNNLRKDVRNAVKDIQTDNSGAFDLTAGALQLRTLDGTNGTLSLSGPTSGQSFMVILKQDATGSRTVTWWSGILWAGAAAPVLTTTADRYDIFAFTYDGTNYFGTVVGQNYG